MNNTIEQATTNRIRPYYSSTENENAYEVKVYMPGVNKENTQISLENGELIISGSKSGAPSEGWRVLSQESNRADYQLRLGLNVEIDGERIEAVTENGVLKLSLPKAEALKPRKIEIR
ncbi:MAG: Hsp20/alpha crystallin family protein [Opitutales bacterium]|nr:Hsp20/alpha crystallin family protein [Opitutales bacterium]